MDWGALVVSLKLAAATSVCLLATALPISLWLAFSRSKAKPFIEALTTLPFVLPPTVIGFYLLLGFSSFPKHNLAFTFSGLLIGALIFNLPVAIQPFTSTFSMIDRRLLEAASSMGASRLKILWSIIVPLSWPGLMAGLALSFAHTLGEFGVAMMIGGNLAGETRTVSIAIYDEVQGLNFSTAHTIALTQVVIGFILLVSVFWLKGVQNRITTQARAGLARARRPVSHQRPERAI